MRKVSLLQFQSRVDGRTAHVKIFATRIVWTLPGARAVTEMVPLSAISSITTSRSANSKWSLVVMANGKTIEFLVDRAIAEQARAVLQTLVAKVPAAVDNAAPPTGRGNLAEDLIRLKWLLDNGMLTEPEFDEQRARLFGR